jgi:hypothetical protein
MYTYAYCIPPHTQLPTGIRLVFQKAAPAEHIQLDKVEARSLCAPVCPLSPKAKEGLSLTLFPLTQSSSYGGMRLS